MPTRDLSSAPRVHHPGVCRSLRHGVLSVTDQLEQQLVVHNQSPIGAGAAQKLASRNAAVSVEGFYKGYLNALRAPTQELLWPTWGQISGWLEMKRFHLIPKAVPTGWRCCCSELHKGITGCWPTPGAKRVHEFL